MFSRPLRRKIKTEREEREEREKGYGEKEWREIDRKRLMQIRIDKDRAREVEKEIEREKERERSEQIFSVYDKDIETVKKEFKKLKNEDDKSELLNEAVKWAATGLFHPQLREHFVKYDEIIDFLLSNGVKITSKTIVYACNIDEIGVRNIGESELRRGSIELIKKIINAIKPGERIDYYTKWHHGDIILYFLFKNYKAFGNYKEFMDNIIFKLIDSGLDLDDLVMGRADETIPEETDEQKEYKMKILNYDMNRKDLLARMSILKAFEDNVFEEIITIFETLSHKFRKLQNCIKKNKYNHEVCIDDMKEFIEMIENLDYKNITNFKNLLTKLSVMMEVMAGEEKSRVLNKSRKHGDSKSKKGGNKSKKSGNKSKKGGNKSYKNYK